MRFSFFFNLTDAIPSRQKIYFFRWINYEKYPYGIWIVLLFKIIDLKNILGYTSYKSEDNGHC